MRGELHPPASKIRTQMPKMAACDKALGICEILEHIIYFLPPRKILTVEPVSKTWKALIDNSKKITRARCLAPLDSASIGSSTNPVYETGADVRFHPLLQQTDTLSVYPNREPVLLHEYGCFVTNNSGLERFPDVDRSTYLTSPPMTSLWVAMRFETHSVDRPYACKQQVLRAERGLRFADLLDAAAGADGWCDVTWVKCIVWERQVIPRVHLRLGQGCVACR